MSNQNCSKNKIYGPILPPGLSQTDDKDEDSSEDDEIYGPKLPEPTKTVIGPVIPQHLLPESNNQGNLSPESENKINDDEIGDDEEEEEDDGEVYGPLPPGEIDLKHTHSQSRIIKKDSGPKREKWMLEPGKALKQKLNLQQKSITKFQQKTGKEKPLTVEEKLEAQALKEKDAKMEEFLKKYEKTNKRTVSLLDQHRENLKKNKFQKTEKTERKEFDRERDLCLPRMDSKAKKSLIKEASSTFGSRFSSGKFEKFL